MEQLEALSKRLGRLKGVDKLYAEARKAKIDVTKSQVKDFVGGVGQKQVLAQSQPSLGKTAVATIENKGSRWMLDLLQFRFSGQDDEETDDEGDESKKRYCLLLVNVFDRKLYGVTVTDKSAETTLVAVRKLMKKLGDDMKGGVLSTDLGREFNNDQFQKVLEAHDVAHKTKGNSEPNAFGCP